MALQPVAHSSLADRVAGHLAAKVLDGTFRPGEQLPPERELISQLDVSRATLREALRAMAERELIEARAGVGWFARAVDESNLAAARELAKGAAVLERESLPADRVPAGPRRVPVGREKPIHVPNLRTDRLGTFEFLSWWERDRVQAAKVLIVGAGALGNEVLKNLALMGVGHLFIVDFDKVEAANLSRSVLFRESDSGRRKAEVAAARAKNLNPEVSIQYLQGDVTTELGLGVIRRMDVVVGCLDNREARLAVNRFCYWMNKPWVDGAIQELFGLARVFVPGEGACYECTLTEQARRDLSLRYSCPLLARENILLGKVPTTPTIASIIGAIQSQEALKLLHKMPVEPGKVLRFNGLTNEMHTSAYTAREDCESHWTYGDVVEIPARAEHTTLREMLRIARTDLGPEAVIELDQELVLSLACPQCKTVEPVLAPLSEVSFEAGHCPACGTLREVSLTHVISGAEDFLHRTLASVGVPPLHILRAHNGREFRFYELSGDARDALHFAHFTSAEPLRSSSGPRIRLGQSAAESVPEANPTGHRIVLTD